MTEKSISPMQENGSTEQEIRRGGEKMDQFLRLSNGKKRWGGVSNKAYVMKKTKMKNLLVFLNKIYSNVSLITTSFRIYLLISLLLWLSLFDVQGFPRQIVYLVGRLSITQIVKLCHHKYTILHTVYSCMCESNA